MDVFCVGMYRSGSTWQYDVASHLLERHRGGKRLGFVTAADYTPPPDPTSAWRILKTHDRHEPFAAALANRSALALYSFRDLRDVCFSLMHKFRASFTEVTDQRQLLQLCLANDAFWRPQPGVLCQRYESIMAEPAQAVEAIASHLGVTLAVDEASELVAEYSLSANRARISVIANRLRSEGVNLDDPVNAVRWDADTLLHWNHIRAGRVGDWRHQATPRQLVRLGEICGAWLLANGYEADMQWVRSGGGMTAAFWRWFGRGAVKARTTEESIG